MNRFFPITLSTAAVVLALCLLPRLGQASAYDIQLRYEVEDAVIFPVAKFVPDDLTNFSDLDLSDSPFFFTMTITGPANDDSRHSLWIRMECNGDPIVTAGYRPVLMSTISEPTPGKSTTNSEFETLELRSMFKEVGDVKAFLDGDWLRAGTYHLFVILSDATTWEGAWASRNDLGWNAATAVAENTVNLELELPADQEEIASNPTFEWTFPLRKAMRFYFDLVSGDPNEPAESAMSRAVRADYFATGYQIPGVAVNGNRGSFTYTGGFPNRQLIGGLTYFWRITARVATVFPGDSIDVVSVVHKFSYAANQNNPDGLGGNGGGGDEGGEESGGAGIIGTKENNNDGPPPESPVFTSLHRILDEDQYQLIISKFANLNGWDVQTITIDGQTITLEGIARILKEGNVNITTISVVPEQQ